jgi:prepilin peptidase CpaA
VLIDILRLLLFPALMAFAASSDLLTMTISNRLSLALAAGFFLLVLATGMSLAAVGWHLAAALLVLAVAFGFFSLGWIGGGDAKLAAATALWFGFDYLLAYLVYASLLGGVLTLLLLQFRRLPLPGLLARQPWIRRLHEKEAGVPYGIALAAAAMLIYPQTGWMPGGWMPGMGLAALR